MAVAGTGQHLGEIEYSWFASRSGITSDKLNDHKLAYFISEGIGENSLNDMEIEWLQGLTGTPATRDLQSLWQGAVIGEGLTPALSIAENKYKYFKTVST